MVVSNRPQREKPRAQQVNSEVAKWAWDQVESVATQERRNPDVQSRYHSLARGLPSMLQTSGLGQTMAFLYAKSKSKSEIGDSNAGADAQGARHLYQHLAQRVLGEGQRPAAADTDHHRAMREIVSLSPAEYRRLSREIALAAEWLKRFAEGRLETEG